MSVDGVDKIVEEIKNPGNFYDAIDIETLGKVAKNTGLSVKGVEWNIKRLRDSGILRRVGSPRSGHWEAVAKKPGKEKVNQ